MPRRRRNTTPLTMEVMVRVVRTRAKKTVWPFCLNSTATMMSEATSAMLRVTWKTSNKIPKIVSRVAVEKKLEQRDFISGRWEQEQHFSSSLLLLFSDDAGLGGGIERMSSSNGV